MNLPIGVDDPGEVREARYKCSECGNEFETWSVEVQQLCPLVGCLGCIREFEAHEYCEEPSYD